MMNGQQDLFDLLDRMTDGFYALDAEWRFTCINVVAERLLQRKRESLLGRSLWGEFPESVDTVFYSRCQEAFRTQTVAEFEAYYPPFGKWFEVRVFPSGSGLSVFFRDVSEARRAAQRVENLYQLLFDGHSDAVGYIGPEGLLLSINDAAVKLTGYDRSRLLSMPLPGLIWPDDVEEFETRYRLAAAGTAQNLEMALRHQDGHRIAVDVTLLPIMIEGRILGVYGICKDITSRKKAEERLLQAQRIGRFGSWERTLSGDAVYWSEEMYQIMDVDDRTRIPDLNQIQERMHPEDLPRVQDAFRRIVEKGKYEAEFRLLLKDGGIRHIYTRGELVTDREGRTTAYGHMHDITKQKQAEESLRRSRSMLEMAQRLAGIGYFEWDLRKQRLYWSDELYAVWGIKKETTLLDPEVVIGCIHPDDQAHVRQQLLQTQAGEPMVKQYRVVRPDGGIRVVYSLSRILLDENGQAVSLFGSIRDITDQLKTDDLLRKSEKLSVAGQLAAGLAHEIRNPLTALKGFTKLMGRSSGEDKNRYYDIMMTEFTRIELILGELLILAKPQAVAIQKIAPEDVLMELLELIGSQATMTNVVLETDFQPGRPMIDGEPNQLKQVFVNVMKNAIEAMPNGGRLRVMTEHEAGKAITIRFQDEGCGIPAERLPRLGEPFYTTKEKGTGLGLMITHKIIEEHGGTIEYESELGKGTSVTIRFPAAAP